ncbi:MAG: hypothetical protein FWG23_00345 [Eggerthellaceae bacterium]|nr:hypothetical protein [Eggerthellaceae bacterium]
MSASNKDREMLGTCIEYGPNIFNSDNCIHHPLDTQIISELTTLYNQIGSEADDFEIFKYREDSIDSLWRLLIEKSIKCLRFFDSREPFSGNAEKAPMAYGVDKLKKYYDDYTEFERVLYGSSKYYRDHVIHVFRTWLSGVVTLINNNGQFLNFIQVQEKEEVHISEHEKLSMWTIIALTHDLGYPLEQATKIIDTTRDMVSTFVTNPGISMDLSFHGVQNYMNDFIVRLISSKMVAIGVSDQLTTQQYVARLQPKYYFKFQKSLEKTKHGIVSTLIIYKLLTYFLESDYSINEDYMFDEEERRQFYIRREILRAIASHTCKDVYHLYLGSFAFLLILSDDTQEWGRKYLSELYVRRNHEYYLNEIGITLSEDTAKSPHNCTIDEEISIPEGSGGVIDLLSRLHDQSLDYITIFRDGQDTEKRDFSFNRKFVIKHPGNIVFSMELQIKKDGASELVGNINYTATGTTNKKFGEVFFKELQKLGIVDNDNAWEVFSNDGNPAEKSSPEQWRSGKFAITLIS